MRKICKTVTSTIQLTKKDETYTLNTMLLLMKLTQKFKLNEENEITTADARKVQSTFIVKDDILTEKQIGEKTFNIVREFFDYELIITLTVGDVESKS